MPHWTTPVPSARWALFLDVDGTLLDFAADPAAVRADAPLVQLLELLRVRLSGALALVSGRPIDGLDALFAPASFAAAGLHGLELRREPRGAIERTSVQVPPLARERLVAFAAREPGVLLEDKGATLALHYRGAPAAQERVAALGTELERALGRDWTLQPGACVLELRPAGATKGTAVRELLRTPGFRGRHPVYAGDDLTDLHAFEAVESLGGDAIAVGARVRARWRLDGAGATRAWLAHVLAQLEPRRRTS